MKKNKIIEIFILYCSLPDLIRNSFALLYLKLKGMKRNIWKEIFLTNGVKFKE